MNTFITLQKLIKPNTGNGSITTDSIADLAHSLRNQSYPNGNGNLTVVGSILALKDMYPNDTWTFLYDGFDGMIDKVSQSVDPMLRDINHARKDQKCNDTLQEIYG